MKLPSSKKKPKIKKERTLLEFKAWLEGVEELQGPAWHPTAEQWKLIRESIDGIIVQLPAPVGVPTGPVYRHDDMYPSPPKVVPNFIPPVTSLQSSVPRNNSFPSTLTPDGTGKFKTPNIDTSDGNYGSGFE